MKYKLILIVITMIVLFSFFTGCANRDAYVFYENGAEEQVDGNSIALDSDAASDKDMVAVDGVEADFSNVESEETTTTIYIDICGAVRYPGVYLLEKDSRLFEAVDAAGGLTQDASSEAINQAEPLSDGQKIYIMNRVEWEESKAAAVCNGNISDNRAGVVGESADHSDDGLVNINLATEGELCTLPGIGATRAKAIIEYRDKNGGFSTIEEIQKVSGIKNGTYNKIKDLIIIK